MGRKITQEEMEVEAVTANEERQESNLLKYEDKLKYINAISKPMASKKLNKKLTKLVKKARENKTYMRFGLKDVQSRIRKGEKGLVIFAGDVTPIDVMCHMPAVCEENDIPYCYVPSKLDLALAAGFTSSCLMVLVRDHPDYQELYNECLEEVKTLGHTF